HARSGPSVRARRVFTRPGTGCRAMTTSRASGMEAFDVGDDGVDLVLVEGPLEGRHEGAGLALAHHQAELIGAASLPEIRVAEVPRLGRDRRRRGPISPPLDAVTRRAARLEHDLSIGRLGHDCGSGRAAALIT